MLFRSGGQRVPPLSHFRAATHLTNYSEVNGAVLIHQPQEMLEGAERSNCRTYFPAWRGHGFPQFYSWNQVVKRSAGPSVDIKGLRPPPILDKAATGGIHRTIN